MVKTTKKKSGKRYLTLFFFDRTVPRELYYSIQRRLNILGYGAVWQPNSAIKNVRSYEKIIGYCIRRGIRVIATFDKRFECVTADMERGIKILKLKGGRQKTVNKIIGKLFQAYHALKPVES